MSAGRSLILSAYSASLNPIYRLLWFGAWGSVQRSRDRCDCLRCGICGSALSHFGTRRRAQIAGSGQFAKKISNPLHSSSRDGRPLRLPRAATSISLRDSPRLHPGTSTSIW